MQLQIREWQERLRNAEEKNNGEVREWMEEIRIARDSARDEGRGIEMKARIEKLEMKNGELEQELRAVERKGTLEMRGVLDQMNNSPRKVANSSGNGIEKEITAKVAREMEQLKERNRELEEIVNKGLKQKSMGEKKLEAAKRQIISTERELDHKNEEIRKRDEEIRKSDEERRK